MSEQSESEYIAARAEVERAQRRCSKANAEVRAAYDDLRMSNDRFTRAIHAHWPTKRRRRS